MNTVLAFGENNTQRRFPDPRDVVVLTSKRVVENGDWVHSVQHDEDDGAWQLHSVDGSPEDASQSRIVLLRNILKMDPTLSALADLPLGWIAWRDTPDGAWNKCSLR